MDHLALEGDGLASCQPVTIGSLFVGGDVALMHKEARGRRVLDIVGLELT